MSKAPIVQAVWNGVVLAESDDTVVVRNRDAAWYYPSPKAAAEEIAGHVAFWRGVSVSPAQGADARGDETLAS